MIKTTSADGTAIAADRTGSGPALVLVAPALATRAAFAPLAELLAPTSPYTPTTGGDAATAATRRRTRPTARSKTSSR